MSWQKLVTHVHNTIKTKNNTAICSMLNTFKHTNNKINNLHKINHTYLTKFSLIGHKNNLLPNVSFLKNLKFNKIHVS